MMNTVFENIIQMSFSGSFIILALCLMRLVFRRSPRWLICSLWILAAFRLVLPFTIESEHSLVPSTEPIAQMVKTDVETTQDYTHNKNYLLWQGSGTVNSGDTVTKEDMGTQEKTESNIVYNEDDANATPSAKENTFNNLRVLLPYIWLIGVAAVLAYGAVGYILLYRRSAPFIPAEGKIRESEFIFSPFILGVFRPKIYLPKGLQDPIRSHVIAHENAHLQRRDHFIKPIGFIILAFHWFNPLVWLAYILLSRDIEMACDERVIGQMSADARSSYAESLLNYCTGNARVTRRLLNACPLAFGEVSMKKRIKAVINFKRPAAWAIALSLISAVLVGAMFFTNDVAESAAVEQVPVETVKEWIPELTTADFTDENGIVRWPAELLPAGVPDPTDYIEKVNLVEKMGDEVHIVFTGKILYSEASEDGGPFTTFLNEMYETEFVHYGDSIKGLFGFASKEGYFLQADHYTNHWLSEYEETYTTVEDYEFLKQCADEFLIRGEKDEYGVDAQCVGVAVQLTLTVRDDIPKAVFYNYPEADLSLGLESVEFTEWPAELLPAGFPNAFEQEGLSTKVIQDETGITIEVTGLRSVADEYDQAVTRSTGALLLTRELRIYENGDYMYVVDGWMYDESSRGEYDPVTVNTYKFRSFNENVITE